MSATPQTVGFYDTLERPHHASATTLYGTVLPGSGVMFSSNPKLVYNTRLPLRRRKSPCFYPFHGGLLYSFCFAVFVIITYLFIKLLFGDIIQLIGWSSATADRFGYLFGALFVFILLYLVIFDRGLCRKDEQVYYSG